MTSSAERRPPVGAPVAAAAAGGAALSVRDARGRDAEAVGRLWRQIDALHARLQPGYFTGAPRRAATAAEVRRIAEAADQGLFVATLGDDLDRDGEAARVVGLVKVRVYETPDDPSMVSARRGHVEELVVDPSCQRRGIGRELMARASAWCRERGAAQLVLTVWEGNVAAAAFYQRIGFWPLNQVLGADACFAPGVSAKTG